MSNCGYGWDVLPYHGQDAVPLQGAVLEEPNADNPAWRHLCQYDGLSLAVHDCLETERGVLRRRIILRAHTAISDLQLRIPILKLCLVFIFIVYIVANNL